VQRISFWLVAAILVLSGLSVGCGGSKERGKNLDYDRPKASEKKS